MARSRKSIDRQVIVITGASSGIGLATAEAAAAKGASLVLIARSAITLQRLARKIDETGQRALSVVCDVSDRNQVELAARQAMEHFGRIDTWVNDAGVGIYGRLDEVLEADSRRMFDINFWGVVHGSLAALRYLRLQGGALINVGSEVSEGAVPLLGMYTAAKHAVKGFTDTLRIETEEVDKADVSITLIEPQAVDTPFPQHARNYMDREPKLPPPTISPERVAKAILRAAVRPARVVRVGGGSMFNTALAKLAPGAADRLAAKQYTRQQADRQPVDPRGVLFRSSESAGFVGQMSGLEA